MVKDDLETTSMHESPFFDETINFESSNKLVQIIPKPVRLMHPTLTVDQW